MAKRRRVKKNVSSKVDTANKVKSSDQSASEKGVKKVSSRVESPQPSGAKKQKLDTRTEGSPKAEKYVPPFTASQRVVGKARDKLQLSKTKMNSQESSSTESQNGDVDSNAENIISVENNGERKEEKISANTCLGDVKDKAMSEVVIYLSKDKESILKSNESAACFGNSKVSEISGKHFLESDEGKQVNDSICVEVPKLSFIIKKYYVDIEPDQELNIVEPIAQAVSCNPLNSRSRQEMEKGNEQEEKEKGKENEQGEEKENEQQDKKGNEQENENEQEQEEEKENVQEEEKENEQEKEKEIEKEIEKEEEEKDDKKGIENSKHEGYESKSMDMVDNQISSQPNEMDKSNSPTCPPNDCKSEDIKTSLAETEYVQKENEKKAITENISTDSAKSDKDELNINDNQPNVSLTSDHLGDQQTDQTVPTDIVLEECQESEPGSNADEQKAFGRGEKKITSSCLNDNNDEKTKENNIGAMASVADSEVDTQSFAKEFEVLEELLPKDDMGLFDDVMDDQLKSTRDEAEIPEGDSTMKFLIDELSSLKKIQRRQICKNPTGRIGTSNCMVMNYQKAVDETKRHYKLSNRY